MKRKTITRARGYVHPKGARTVGSGESSLRRPVRILVADDQEIVRAGLRTILAGQPDLRIVGETGTAAGILSEARRVKPNLVLMEARLPGGLGIEVCRLLKRAHPAIRLFIVTKYHSPATFYAATAAGIHGYALKGILGADLLPAIRAVAGGASYVQSGIVDQAVSRLSDSMSGAWESGMHLLSPQQRRVVHALAQGKTNREIAVDLALSEKTVKNYLMNIFTKLQIGRRSQAVSLYVRHCQEEDSYAKAL